LVGLYYQDCFFEYQPYKPQCNIYYFSLGKVILIYGLSKIDAWNTSLQTKESKKDLVVEARKSGLGFGTSVFQKDATQSHVIVWVQFAR
jgi:hypothetical protein